MINDSAQADVTIYFFSWPVFPRGKEVIDFTSLQYSFLYFCLVALERSTFTRILFIYFDIFQCLYANWFREVVSRQQLIVDGTVLC